MLCTLDTPDIDLGNYILLIVIFTTLQDKILNFLYHIDEETKGKNTNLILQKNFIELYLVFNTIIPGPG